MSNIDSIDSNEPKDLFTGFHVTQKGKDRLDYMAGFFFKRGLIPEKTFSAAARYCMDIGFTLVSEVIEAEGEGKLVNKVTFSLTKMKLPDTIENRGQF